MTSKGIWTYLLEEAKKHGLSFVILVAVWFYAEYNNRELRRELSLCNSEVIELHKEIIKEIKAIKFNEKN